jgi:tRNA-Thr(GGU) m(6)t(6)A37 methyltransferase TsaA
MDDLIARAKKMKRLLEKADRCKCLDLEDCGKIFLKKRSAANRSLDKMNSYILEPVGFIRSTVKGRQDAPRQGPEGAPDAWLEIEPQFAEALHGMEVGHELIVITWLHQAKRDVLKGHPRSDQSRPLTGVFYTRSPARPNPLGLHPVTLRAIEGTRLKIGPIEAFDGTPVVDIKSASTRADR